MPDDVGPGRSRVSSTNLEDPDFVFNFSDVHRAGQLDWYEVKQALRYLGLCPPDERIKQIVGRESFKQNADELEREGRARHSRCRVEHVPQSWQQQQRDSVDKRLFAKLVADLQTNKTESIACRPGVPHSLRGMRLAQLEDIQHAFLDDGWLSKRCAEFNEQYAEDISKKNMFESSENLYAIDIFIVRPLTLPCPSLARAKTPVHIVPEATHESSYSELTNPCGTFVDFFVSHWWGHPYLETMRALRSWASRQNQKTSAALLQDIVFWICLFAVNQHRASEEVGTNPENGPFNAAATHAQLGAIMILDESVQPLTRAWCLYEIHRLYDMGRPLELVCSDGPLSTLTLDVAADEKKQARAKLECFQHSLQRVSAYNSQATCKVDQHMIWHWIMEPWGRHRPLSQMLQQRPWKRSVKTSVEPWAPDTYCYFDLNSAFVTFDSRVKGLLAQPLLQDSLHNGNLQAALQSLGLGAPFGAAELSALQHLSGELSGIQTVGPTGQAWDLLHVAAFFGHYMGMTALLAHSADVASTTAAGKGIFDDATALWISAYQGHSKLVALLLNRAADPHARNSKGRTVLFGAAGQGHQQVVELLLATGPDLEPADSHTGASALHYAAYNGHRNVVELLLEQGADYEVTTTKAIPLVDSGSTPLHTAAGCGHIEIVDLLLAWRANTETRNCEGCTPLHAAARHAPLELGVIEALRRWDANLEATLHT